MITEERPVPGSITVLIDRWRSGEATALEELVPLVYSELRKLAQIQISFERANHTLQPTALVHEAYLRLAGSAAPPAGSRKQFYGIAARLMRQILVDHARRHLRGKRGAAISVPLLDDMLRPRETTVESFLALDQALTRLAEFDARKARAVELRYFTGLPVAEVAETMEVSVMTLHRDLRFATAWLADQLRRKDSC